MSEAHTSPARTASIATPARHFIRVLAAIAVGAIGSVAIGAAGIVPVASADPPDFYMFDNGILRFGGNADDDCYSGCDTPSAPEHSINANGLPKQPFYWSIESDKWFKLTFWTYPLNLAIGTGTNGSNWSGATVSDVGALDNLVIDTSGFVVTGPAGTGVKGYGVMSATGTTTVDGQLVEITNRSEFVSDGAYVKLTTSLKNLSASPMTNTTMWVGTQDDFVGSSDQPTKTKGNVVDGAFTPTGSPEETASALLIESGPEGVIFYSTTPGTNASIDSCCSFANAYNIDPTESPTVLTGDGSYSMNVPVSDLAPGGSTSITWFYAAGATETLNEVISSVSAAARPAAPTVTPGDTAVTIGWSAPESTDPITDYMIRHRVNGTGDTWTELRHGSTTEPLTRHFTGLANGTLYDFQVAAVTGTAPDEVVGLFSSSATVAPGSPWNTVRPTISGTPLVGETLTVTDPDGNWISVDGTPMTASRQWTSNGDAISGATGASFVVGPDEAGTTINVLATRTNTSGPTTVTAVAGQPCRTSTWLI